MSKSAVIQIFVLPDNQKRHKRHFEVFIPIPIPIGIILVVVTSLEEKFENKKVERNENKKKIVSME